MWAVLAVSLALLAVALWNALAWPRVGAGATAAPPLDISVLIPARNEAPRITGCLEAALAQAAPVREVLVYDDHSSDGTADRVREATARDGRVRLVPPAALPAGWCGKPFACAQLAGAAVGRWVLFLDADTRLQPGALEAMAAEVRRREATLLSCWPGLDIEGFWERLLMPMLNFVVFSIFPAPYSLRSMRASLALAHGACLLVERDAYLAAGGHEAVRTEIFEDTMLARHWRRSGRRGVCLDGSNVARVRMYADLRGIWLGFRKNFRPAFRTAAGFWAFWLFHAAVFALPPLLAAAALAGLVPGALLAPAAGAAGAAVAIRLAQAARFGFPAWSAVLHPVAELALLGLGLDSWARYRLGGGVTWKDRRYGGRGGGPGATPGGEESGDA